MGKFKFDVAIGNPPYHDEADGENENYKPSIYNYFMDETFKICDKVELIHPARFLFDAGNTPKLWNQKMLNDPHLKTLFFEQDSSKVFPGTDIKGGIVVTYHDNNTDFGAIKVFSPNPEMHTILQKASPKTDADSIMSIIYLQNKFDLDSLYVDYPKFKKVIGSQGKDKRFRNNIFDKIDIFSDIKENEDDLKILGVIKNKRYWKFIAKKYVDGSHENLFKYKVLVPESNGRGDLNDVFSTPIIAVPGEGFTQSFISIGAFNSTEEASNALKYIKTRFLRTMLGFRKITQHNPPATWQEVPIQDFSSKSDIDWSKSIHEIDLQFYKKYRLSDKEVAFIETHVKEMA